MKKITTGILMLFLLALATSVGYASNAPTNQTATQEVSQKAPILLAQLEAPATEATATAPEGEAAVFAPVPAEPTKADKAAEQVLEIANALDIEVDTSASPNEIYQSVLEQAQSIPKKGSGAAAWISWILACLGIGGTIFFFIKNQKLKKGS